MILPNGKELDVPVEMQVLDEIVQALSPTLASVAQKALRLYENAYPTAIDFNDHARHEQPVRFRHMPGSEDKGTVFFRVGPENHQRHHFLWITLGDDRSLGIVRDQMRTPQSSHLTEVKTTAKPLREYLFSDFTVNIFRRKWSGGAQGTIEPDFVTNTYYEADHQMQRINDALDVAGELLHQRATRVS